MLQKAVLLVLLAVCAASAIKHDLRIQDDGRRDFMIEKFGLGNKGVLGINMTRIVLMDSKKNVIPFPVSASMKPVGILVRVTEKDDAGAVSQPGGAQSNKCPFDSAPRKNEIMHLISAGSFQTTINVMSETEGIYNVYFINCNDNTKIAFDLTIEQYNVDAAGIRNYLHIGQFPLPGIFGGFTVLYLAAGAFWVYRYLRGSERTVNKVHWLMTAVVFIRAFSLLCLGVEYHWIQLTGETGAWNVLYYIFSFLRGIGMFAVIAAIGTGWSFLTPFLGDREKKIFLIVIPLQILDNIAMIVTEENMEGTVAWLTWRDMFRIIDIVCCFAVLVPIFWSIHHLKQAAQSDGKARRSMEKLQVFRRFYLMLIAYFYFTRIMVTLMSSSLPFRYTWATDFSSELATLMFFVATGYIFRPVKDNVYFKVDEDEENVKGAVTLEEIEAAAAL